jgi:hypothetical protein
MVQHRYIRQAKLCPSLPLTHTATEEDSERKRRVLTDIVSVKPAGGLRRFWRESLKNPDFLQFSLYNCSDLPYYQGWLR